MSQHEDLPTYPALLSRDLGAVLASYFKSYPQPSLVVAPFINSAVLAHVLSGVPERSATIVTSWSIENLAQGVASLDLYELCADRGWALYICDDLHSKFYSCALRTAWVGSANMTARGLGMSPKSNLELLSFLPKEECKLVAHSYYEVLRRSVLVDDDIYAEYSTLCASLPHLGGHKLPPAPNLATAHMNYLVSALPASSNPLNLWKAVHEAETLSEEDMIAAQHDIATYGIVVSDDQEEFHSRLRQSFFNHPFIIALMHEIESSSTGLYFGAAKEWIQHKCTDVPTPYRKDLTHLVQNIYEWVPRLAPDSFSVSRPNYSQLLSKVT